MSPRGLSLLALSGVLAVAACAALSLAPRAAPAAQKIGPGLALAAKPAPSNAALGQAPGSNAPLAERDLTIFERLPALHIVNQTTREAVDSKLYDAAGNIDEGAARKLDDLLCDARKPKQHETTTIHRRTLQLLFKAAYHFRASEVEVVSAYRKPGRRREGPHGTGSAIDFRLSSVEAKELAAYLRQIPRTGVGIYTHPKTQYVHLDSREHSFHWIDASPPRRHWREKSIGERDLIERDRLYLPAQDLPEASAGDAR